MNDSVEISAICVTVEANLLAEAVMTDTIGYYDHDLFQCTLSTTLKHDDKGNFVQVSVEITSKNYYDWIATVPNEISYIRIDKQPPPKGFLAESPWIKVYPGSLIIEKSRIPCRTRCCVKRTQIMITPRRILYAKDPIRPYGFAKVHISTLPMYLQGQLIGQGAIILRSKNGTYYKFEPAIANDNFIEQVDQYGPIRTLLHMENRTVLDMRELRDTEVEALLWMWADCWFSTMNDNVISAAVRLGWP